MGVNSIQNIVSLNFMYIYISITNIYKGMIFNLVQMIYRHIKEHILRV